MIHRNLNRLSWPSSDSRRLLRAIAARKGWGNTSEFKPASTSVAEGDGTLDNLSLTADGLGFEAQPVQCSLEALADTLRSCGPALVTLPKHEGQERRLLATLGCTFGRIKILDPQGKISRQPVHEIVRIFREREEEPYRDRVDQVVQRLRIDSRRADRVRKSLLERQLAPVSVGPIWICSPSRNLDTLGALKSAGLHRELVIFLMAYVASYSLLLVSWWALGRGTLGGHFSPDWLFAWAVLLSSVMGPRLLSVWSKARISVGLGVFLKKRLLEGILRTTPQSIKHEGVGRLLGRVLESEAVEHYLLQGAFLTAAGAVELCFSTFVVYLGAGGLLHTAILALWCLVVLIVAHCHFLDRRRWTRRRLALTHEMVEAMVGNRTRLVQLKPSHWHRREDALLNAYVESSEQLDQSQLLLLSLAPRGWILMGFCGLVPAFVGASSLSLPALAIGVGGVLTAFRGFSKVSEGVSHLANAWIAWTSVASIAARAAAEEVESSGFNESQLTEPRGSQAGVTSTPLLQVRGVTFRRENRESPILDHIDLTLKIGDRWHLQGTSGSGKSTLAAILASGLAPQQGLLLLRGLDLPSWGQQSWRRRVALVPQFHENHVYAGSLAFNLLLGRRWPPDLEDLKAAAEICNELGLGGLLKKMPAGLQQPVGETGWQLSHGEKSRIFLARALLQDAELLILDETLAGLDPETALKVMEVLERRANTLVVIAHP